MKRIISMVGLILVFLVFLGSAPLVSFGDQRVRVIVGFRGDSNYDTSRDQISSMGSIVLEIAEIKAVVLELPQSLVNRIASLPFVRYVDYDKPVKIQQEVQWNIEMINATKVWSTYSPQYGDAAYGYGLTIRVAVVDTGIYYRHPDLKDSVTWCVVSLRNTKTLYEGTNLKNCDDPNGHGTHVAGIIAARLNGIGVAGAAPKALLYAVRVLDASGSGYVSDVAKGIVEATKGPDNNAGTTDDADVISMSLGGPDSPVLRDAVIYAYSYGVVLVAAAGNEGASQPSYPAAYPEVIAVGAIDINYQVPSWSNRNPDLVAPGVSILSTWKGGSYAYASGTSMAAPHVSATVALIQALRLASGHGKLAPDQVRDVLISTAIDLGSSGYDPAYGYGLVDAYKAVNYALNMP
ncbi:MAG: S8 family peptidase [Sulfolobales archaeon]